VEVVIESVITSIKEIGSPCERPSDLLADRLKLASLGQPRDGDELP